MGRRPGGSGGLPGTLLGRLCMNETTLASFKAKLGKTRFTMIGDVQSQYIIKKDALNKQVAAIR